MEEPTTETRPDRKGGILTPKDRKLLLGELEDIGADKTRMRQHRIEKKFRNGLADLAYLGSLSHSRVDKILFDEANTFEASQENISAGVFELFYHLIYHMHQDALRHFLWAAEYAYTDMRAGDAGVYGPLVPRIEWEEQGAIDMGELAEIYRTTGSIEHDWIEEDRAVACLKRHGYLNDDGGF